jgi:hypothetical protein
MNPRQAAVRRTVRRELYSLARRWGVPAQVYRQEDGTFDVEKGTNVPVTTITNLRHFISWTANQTVKFSYDIAFLAANKNFTYGGFYEVGDRLAIITWQDPVDLRSQDYIMYEGVRYNIISFEKIDFELGYLLHLRSTKDQPGYQVIEKTVTHWLDFTQTVSVS